MTGPHAFDIGVLVGHGEIEIAAHMGSDRPLACTHIAECGQTQWKGRVEKERRRKDEEKEREGDGERKRAKRREERGRREPDEALRPKGPER